MRDSLPNSIAFGVGTGARRTDHFKVSQVTYVLSSTLGPYVLALPEDTWNTIYFLIKTNEGSSTFQHEPSHIGAGPRFPLI